MGNVIVMSEVAQSTSMVLWTIVFDSFRRTARLNCNLSRLIAHILYGLNGLYDLIVSSV